MSIVIEQVEKIIDKKRILSDITLTAGDGEILGLIGPSGAGKTTLIRLITGAIKADSGKITAGGVAVPNTALLKQIGFMPQEDALYHDLSGLDNLKLFGRLYGLRGKRLNERCGEMLRLIGLYDDMDKPVSDYSAAMKKQLSLIIVLLHNPQYLVLDEPTAGIDPVVSEKIWAVFSALSEQGKTLIISSPIISEAVGCTKCALLYNGRLIAFDTVDELLQTAENGGIEKLFLNAGEDNE